MKIERDDLPKAEQFNTEDDGELQMEASAKAFQIVSSGLYSNKIRAVIRELSTNAWDSHIDADNTDTPFTVHLPNSIEPWFSVRDYGVGLDREEVKDIFLTYFKSTKNDRNDSTGMLGLGSKSPLSMANSFNVTAIKDGIKRSFTVYIKDNGKPGISFMGQTKTDEPSGVEILLTVEREFNRWHNEAQEIFYHFPVCPEVVGVAEFRLMDREYDMVNIAPGAHSLMHSGTTYAVQGPVEYPINTDVLKQDEYFPEELEYLLGFPFEIHFQLGELDVAASREELSYIPLTVKNIAKKYREIHENLRDKVREEITKDTDRKNLEKINQYVRPGRVCSRSVLQHCVAEWAMEKSSTIARVAAPTLYMIALRGAVAHIRNLSCSRGWQPCGTLPTKAKSSVYLQFFHQFTSYFVLYPSIIKQYLGVYPTSDEMYSTQIYVTNAGNTRTKKNTDGVPSVYTDGNLFSIWDERIIINDTGSDALRRIRAPENQEVFARGRNWLVFDCHKTFDKDNVLRMLKDFEVDDVEIVFTSDLEKPAPVNSIKKNRNTFRVLSNTLKFQQTQVTPEANDNTIYYIVTYGSRPLIDPADKNSVTDMQNLRTVVRYCGIDLFGKEIISVPFKQYKNVKDTTSWVCINTEIFVLLDNVENKISKLLNNSNTEFAAYNIEDFVTSTFGQFINMDPALRWMRGKAIHNFVERVVELCGKLPNHELKNSPIIKVLFKFAKDESEIKDFTRDLQRASKMTLYHLGGTKAQDCKDKIQEFEEEVKKCCHARYSEDEYKIIKKYAPVLHCLQNDRLFEEHLQSLVDFAIMLQDK